jgi:hypothetical protein
MEITCGNCNCSKCKLWKKCNDEIYEIDYWCFRCPELAIDHCHEKEGECEAFIYDEEQTHPIYSDKTCEEAANYYEQFDWEFVYQGNY